MGLFDSPQQELNNNNQPISNRQSLFEAPEGAPSQDVMRTYKSRYTPEEVQKFDFPVYESHDNEDTRAQNQSVGEQIGHGLARLVGTTGTKFLEGLGYTATAIPALLAGDAGIMVDNGWSSMWSNAEQSIKDSMPVYHTRAYEDGNVLDKMGTMGFWMDDMIDGAAFMASAYLGAYATTPFKVGSKVAGAYGKLAQNFSKALRLEKAGVATGKSIGNLNKIAHEIDLGTMTLMNSSMEAGFEAKDTKNQLFEIYKGQGMSDEEANKKASEGALETFKANMLFLLPSNYIENSMLFKSFKGSKGAIERAVEKGVITAEGSAKAVANRTFKQNLGTFAKDAIGTGIVEGFYEENIQQAQQNYEKNMAEGIASKGWLTDIVSNMAENFTTNEGQQAIVTGFILGMIPGGYGGVREAKAENKQIQKAQQALTLTTKLYRDKITDFYERNDKGEIVSNPDGSPKLDKQKQIDAILGLMGKKESFDQKTAAALAGNKVMFDAIKDREFSALAYSFFEQEAGSKFFEAHIDSMSKEEAKDFARVNDKDGSGLDITPSRVANDYKQRARELQALYDVIQERHAGFMSLPTDSKESAKDAVRFIERLKQVQFAEAASQTFWSKQQETLQTELIALQVNPNLETTPLLKERATRLEKNIKQIDELLKESKDTYKTLIDKKAQAQLFKDWQDKKKAAETESTKPKEPQVESRVPKDISELQQGMKVKLHDGTIATYTSRVSKKDGKTYHTFTDGKKKMTLIGDEINAYLANITIMADKSAVDVENAKSPEEVRAALTDTASLETKVKAQTKILVLEEQAREAKHKAKLLKERLSKESTATLQSYLQTFQEPPVTDAILEILNERSTPKAIMQKYEQEAHSQKQAEIEAAFKDSIIEEMSDDGRVFKIKDKIYKNGYSDPLMAINRNKNGDIVSVTLHDENEQPRTFTSEKWVDQISYAIMLQQLAVATSEEKTKVDPEEVQAIKEDIATSVTETKILSVKKTSQDIKEELYSLHRDLEEVIQLSLRIREELIGLGFGKKEINNDKDIKELKEFEKSIKGRIASRTKRLQELKADPTIVSKQTKEAELSKVQKALDTLLKERYTIQNQLLQLEEAIKQISGDRQLDPYKDYTNKQNLAALQQQTAGLEQQLAKVDKNITGRKTRLNNIINDKEKRVQTKPDTAPVSGEQTSEGVQTSPTGETTQTQDQTGGSQTEGTQTSVTESIAKATKELEFLNHVKSSKSLSEVFTLLGNEKTAAIIKSYVDNGLLPARRDGLDLGTIKAFADKRIPTVKAFLQKAKEFTDTSETDKKEAVIDLSELEGTFNDPNAASDRSKVSVAAVQRKYKVGFNRASEMIDAYEAKKKDEDAVEAIKQQVAIDQSELPSQSIPDAPKEAVKQKSVIETLQTEFKLTEGLPLRPIFFNQLKNGDLIILSTNDFTLDKNGNMIHQPSFNQGWLIKTKVSITLDGKITFQPQAIEIKKENRNGPVFINDNATFTRLSDGDTTQSALAWNQINQFEHQFNMNNTEVGKAFSFYRIEESHMPAAVVTTINNIPRHIVKPALRPVETHLQNAKGENSRTIDGSEKLDFTEYDNKLQLQKLTEDTIKGNPITIHYEDLSDPSITAGTAVEYVLIENDWYTGQLENKTWAEEDNWKQAPIYIKINGRIVEKLRAYKSEAEHGSILDRKFIYDSLKKQKRVYGSIVKSKLKPIDDKLAEEVNKLTGPTNLNNISVENRNNNLREPRYVSLQDSFSKMWTWDPETNEYSIKDNVPIVLAVTEGTYKVGAKTPTISIPEGIDPRVYSKMITDNIDRTYVDDTSGHVFAIALNPLGEYRAIHLHTQALSALAVQTVLKKLTTPNRSLTKDEVTILNKIVHTKSIPQGAMSDEFYLSILSVKDGMDRDSFINYMSPKTGKIIRITIPNFNEALKGNPYKYDAVRITVNDENRAKYEPDIVPPNLDVLEDFKDFLSKKRYNVEAERLNKESVKYTSEVTGVEYPNYLAYLTSPSEFTETAHPSDAKGILVSDVWNDKGTIYRDIGITLGKTRLQSEPIDEPTPENVDTVGDIVPTPEPTKGKVEGIDLSGIKLPTIQKPSDKAHRLTGVKEGYKEIDEKKAKAFLEKRFGKGTVSFYPLLQAITEKGGYLAHGYVEKAAVHLYDHAEVGSEYHEAFHMSFRYMLSDKQRAAIYNEARDLYGNTLTDLELEERMAEDFRDYRMSEDAASLPTKILNWFKNLLAYIKAIVTGNRDIQSLKRAISSNLFTKTEKNALTLSRKISDNFKPQVDVWSKAYSLKPEFTLERQEDVLDSLATEALDIIDQFDDSTKKVKVKDVFNTIRNKFINNVFIKEDGEKVTLAEFNEMLKTGKAPEGVTYNTDKYDNDTLGAMFVIAMKWHDTIPDKKLGNITEVGWTTLLKQRLEHFGIQIKGDKKIEESDIEEYENQTENDISENQDEHIHGDSHFYTNTKDSLSAETRQWIARLRDGTKEPNFLGYRPYIPFDKTYLDILANVSDIFVYKDMLQSLQEEAPYKPNLAIVLSELKSKDAYLQAQFFKSFALSYNKYITGIEEREYPVKSIDAKGEPVYGTPITKVKYIESNREGTEYKLINEWKNNAFSSSTIKSNSLYIFNPTSGLYEIRQTAFEPLIKDLKTIQTINDTKDNTVSSEQISALVSFLDRIGIKILKEHLQEFLDKGITLKGQKVNGARLYRYLTLPSQDNNNIALVNIMQSIADVKVENRMVTSATIKAKPGDLYIDNASMIKRFAFVEKLFQTEKGGSFMDERNKSIYPYNLSTPISEIFTKIKTGKIGKDSIYYKDVAYNPTPTKDSDDYISPYLRLFQIQSFRDMFDYQDFSAYKKRGEAVASQEYSLMHEVATKLNRYQAFLNSGDKNVSKLALQTLGDRDRMIFVTIPRFDTYSKQLGYSSERDIWRAWLVQDINAINKAFNETKELPENQLRPNYHYGKKVGDGKGNGLKIRQIERSTIGDDLANRIEAFAKKPLEPDSKEMAALITEALGKIDSFIKTVVDEQVALLKDYEILAYAKDGKTINKKSTKLSPDGMERYNWNVEEMVKDYTVNNMIFKNEIMKFTGIDYSIYKNMEDTSKRDTLLATPGTKQIIRGEIESDPEYGAEPMYTTAFSNDLYNSNRLQQESKSYRDLLKALNDPLAQEIEEQYSPEDPSVNRTDAQGFHSIQEQRNIMMGDGTWLDTHTRAYQNYISQRVWLDPVTNKRPLLPAVKTSIDSHVLVNGTVCRVIIKHSSTVLLEEATKSYPVTDDLRQRLELTGNYTPGEKYNKDGNLKVIRSLNFESTGKGSRWGMIDIDEDSVGGRFQDLEQIEIPRENVRVPQIIPSENKREDQLWGSQIRKIVISNIDLDSPKLSYILNGGIKGKETALTGRRIFDLYQEAGTQMLKKSLASLYRDLKFDPDEKDEKNKLKFLIKLREILKKQNEQRDLPDNYNKVLDLYLDERNKYSYSVPLAFPSYMKKFEQIIFSLFKNNVLNQRVKGESAVQVAELGGHETDGGLKFIRSQTVEEWSNGKKKSVDSLSKKELEDYVNSTTIMHAECMISSSLAYKLGIKAGDRTSINEIPEELRRIVGYRIPYSGKNLTLPLLVVDVLPKENTHQIVVPAGITKQMGSDFDIDKLFLMMPNYTESGFHEYINKRLNEEFGRELIDFKKKDPSPELRKIINTFKDDVKTALNTPDEDITDDSDKDVIKAAAKEFEEKSLVNRDKGNTVLFEKEWYDLDVPLEDHSMAELQNLITDITEAVIRSREHFSEVLRPIDSPTIGDLAAEVSKATGESAIILNHNNPQTEEIIEIRNKAGKTGIGIYATYLTGQAIMQYGKVALVQSYAPSLIIDKKALPIPYTDLSRKTVVPEIEGIYGDKVVNTLVNFTLSERAQAAVDNAKNPYMGLINDNTFTSNVIGLFNVLGLGNKVVTYFLNQPIIRDMTKEYFKKNMTPNQLRDLVQSIGEKWDAKMKGKGFTGLNKSRDEIASTPMDPHSLKRTIGAHDKEGLTPEEIKIQLQYLVNFYKFNIAGQNLAKVNKAFNSDRIKDMSNMGGIEEFKDNNDYVLYGNNTVINGVENILLGDKWKLTKSYNKYAIDSALSFAEQFFPFRKSAFVSVKEQIKKGLNKDSLSKDIHNKLNTFSMLSVFSMKGSPLYEAFSKENIKTLLFDNPNNIVNRFLTLKAKYPEVFATNPFLGALKENTRNIEEKEKKKTDIKLLSFENSYSYSADEKNEFVNGFEEAYFKSPHQDIKDFMRSLVDYSVVSRGFDQSPDTFIDFIPVEVWKDIKNSDYQNVVEYFKSQYASFDSPSFFKDANLYEQFIRNNVGLKGLVPNISEDLKSPQYNTHTFDVDSYSSLSKDVDGGKQWADYFYVRNTRGGTVSLYRLDGIVGNVVKYKRIELLGEPNRFIEVNVRDANGNVIDRSVNRKNELKDLEEPNSTPPVTPSITPSTSTSNEITFSEDPSDTYPPRTKRNASADATIAIAIDFKSLGEMATKKAVIDQGKTYVPIDVKENLNWTEQDARTLLKQLSAPGVTPKTLNIAGNGIYTMKGKYNQQQIDDFVYKVLKSLVDLGLKLDHVRTGGQTGFDEAGAKAAQRLGIKTYILAPKGYKFRPINGKDISNEEAFKSRFNQPTQQQPSEQRESSQEEETVKGLDTKVTALKESFAKAGINVDIVLDGDLKANAQVKYPNTVKVYQGVYNEDDGREINYFTTDPTEAKDYGTHVREVHINTDKFLVKDSLEFNRVHDEYINLGNSRFDILDNSPEGLKASDKFFKFLKNKGYRGYAESSDVLKGVVKGENDYLVSFTKSNEVTPSDAVIRINPNKVFKDTVFHEFGHIYIDLLGYDHPLVQEGIAKLRNGTLWNKIKELYPELDDEQLGKEVLTTSIGNEAADISQESWIKYWVRRILAAIGKLIGINTSASRKLAQELVKGDLRTKEFNKSNLENIKYTQQQKQEEKEEEPKEAETKFKSSKAQVKDVYDKVRDALFRQIKIYKAKSSGKTDQIEKLEKTYKNLDVARAGTLPEQIHALAAYVYEAHDQAIQAGARVNNVITATDQNKAVKDLVDIYEFISSYKMLDAIRGLPDFSTLGMKSQDYKDAEHISALEDAINQRDRIKNFYIHEGIPLLANWLLSFDTGGVNQDIQKYKDSNPEVTNFEVTRDNLIKQLKRAYKDETLGRALLSPLISSHDATLAMFAKGVKRELEDARLQTIADEYVLNEAIDKYAKATGKSLVNSKYFYSDILEETTDTFDSKTNKFVSKLAFVSEYDGAKFFKARHDFFTNINNKLKKEEITQKEYNKAVAVWFQDNTEPLPNWEDIVKKQRETLPSAEFNAWYAENTREVYNSANREPIRELTRPKTSKYTNPRWAQLKANKPAFELHQALTKLYREKQELLFKSQRAGDVVPSIPKSSQDMVLEDSLGKAIKRKAEESVNIMSYDIDYPGIQTQSGEEVKYVPVHYTNSMPINEVSHDMRNSLAVFSDMANSFYHRYKIIAYINLMKDVIGEREVPISNSTGAAIKDALSAKIGIDNIIKKRPGSSNSLFHLEEFINMVYYGERKNRAEGDTVKVFGKDISLSKSADTLIRLTAMNALAGNLLQGVNNVTIGNILTYAEGAGGQHYNRKNWGAAQNKYFSNFHNIVGDIGKLTDKSVIGQIIDHYDLIQGHYLTELGEKVSGSKAKQLFQTSTLFFIQNKGEHWLQSTAGLAMMDKQMVDVKAKDGSISKIKLIDAYEKDAKGRLKLKDGVQWSEVQRFAFMNKVHGINKYLHGTYNTFDKAVASKYVLGRMVLLFRNWMERGWRRRTAKMHPDYEIDNIMEGNYRSFFRILVNQLKGLHTKTFLSWSSLTDLEKSNIRKTIVEINALTVAIVLVMLLAGDPDDPDKEKNTWTENFILYEARRLQSEIMFYVNPTEFWRIMKSPTAAMSGIKKTTDLLDQILPWNITDEYERNSGPHKKGDNKALVKLKKWIPGVAGIENSRDPGALYHWFSQPAF